MIPTITFERHSKDLFWETICELMKRKHGYTIPRKGKRLYICYLKMGIKWTNTQTKTSRQTDFTKEEQSQIPEGKITWKARF